MAQLYGPHYQKLWRDALLLPGQTELLDSLASELASFRGSTPAEALALMKQSWADAQQPVAVSFPVDPTPEALRAYYATQEHGLPASLYWHSLVPDRWALHSVAALHAALQFSDGRRVFEFGHGAGSTAILFARHGFELSLGDVSPAYRALAEHRLALRGLPAEFLDLKREEPAEGAYDVAVSLDVLEHIEDPLPPLRLLWRCLRDGGLLVLNIAFGVHPDNPEHLLPFRTGVQDRIRALGFERIPNPWLLVYYKRPLGRARRALYRAQDLLDAVVTDACTQVPRLQVLLRIGRPPSPR